MPVKSLQVVRRFVLMIFCLFSLNLMAQEKLNKKQLELLEEQRIRNKQTFQSLKKKVGFQTKCDTSNINLTVLETLYEVRGESYYTVKKSQKNYIPRDKIVPQQIGVDACEERFTYVITASGWVLNAATEKEE